MKILQSPTAKEVLRKVRRILKTPEAADIIIHSRNIMAGIKYVDVLYSMACKKKKSKYRIESDEWMEGYIKAINDIIIYFK